MDASGLAVSVIRLSPVPVIFAADENDTLACFGLFGYISTFLVAIHNGGGA